MGYHMIRQETEQLCNMLAHLRPFNLNSIETPFRPLAPPQVDNIMECSLRTILGNPSWLDTPINVEGAGGVQSLRNVLNKIICLAVLSARGNPEQSVYAKAMLRQASNAMRELYLSALRDEMPDSDRSIYQAHWLH